MSIQLEAVLFVLAILFFLSILAGKASSRFGVPALLLFLLVGMFSGSDGLGIQFENMVIAKHIGTIALCIILFSGGLDTNIAEIRPVMAKGIILATLGVFLTAIITGVLI
ncbi:MAG: cation:proton antiporter, partial [Bacteroidales bacterium]|nr:cation:proton antiporter [Bacteroidales bacterium]